MNPQVQEQVSQVIQVQGQVQAIQEQVQDIQVHRSILHHHCHRSAPPLPFPRMPHGSPLCADYRSLSGSCRRTCGP